MFKFFVKNIKRKRKNGFTLVEIIIVISILAILAVAALVMLNPYKQVDKAFNAQRLFDLLQISNYMEVYYNDNQCYPTSLPFGQQWSSGNMVYMQKVPQDPQASNNGGYLYFPTSSGNPSCSQWGVLFAQLSENTTTSCQLPPNCAPKNYDNTQWACKVFGTPDCAILSQAVLPATIANNPTTTSQSVQTSSASSGGGSLNTLQVTLCHSNGNNTYSKITTNGTSDVGGHDGHTADIIPPFAYACATGTCQYPGKNWDANGQAIYNNNCIPAPASMPAVFSYTGSDGSTCQEVAPPDSYVDQLNPSWGCKDSTGFDSTKSGLNSCQMVSNQAAIYRFPCVLYQNTNSTATQITSLTAKCYQLGVGYSFNYQTWKWESICSQGWTGSTTCQNNACIYTNRKTSVAPVIQIISPADNSTMSYPSGPATIDVVIRLVSSSDTIRYYYLEDDEGQGGGGTSCSQINATDWDCSYLTWPKTLRNGNPVRTIYAFAVDNSGNTGFAVTHVNLQ